MQFLPSTLARWAADGDGAASPLDLDDAAVAAARYFCAAGQDLSTGESWFRAVLSYNTRTSTSTRSTTRRPGTRAMKRFDDAVHQLLSGPWGQNDPWSFRSERPAEPSASSGTFVPARSAGPLDRHELPEQAPHELLEPGGLGLRQGAGGPSRGCLRVDLVVRHFVRTSQLRPELLRTLLTAHDPGHREAEPGVEPVTCSGSVGRGGRAARRRPGLPRLHEPPAADGHHRDPVDDGVDAQQRPEQHIGGIEDVEQHDQAEDRGGRSGEHQGHPEERI